MDQWKTDNNNFTAELAPSTSAPSNPRFLVFPSSSFLFYFYFYFYLFIFLIFSLEFVSISQNHCLVVFIRQSVDVEIKDPVAARKVQKADREKLRRDRLNEQFLELGNTLGTLK